MRESTPPRCLQATHHVRFASFPQYLLVQMRRYYHGPDWTPRKMEVLVEVPERLSLEGLRGHGLQPGEELQPAGGQDAAPAAPDAAPAGPRPDGTIVAQLVAMGFSENGSRRAAVATNNSGAEEAMEWVLSHAEDAGERWLAGWLAGGRWRARVPCAAEAGAAADTGHDGSQERK